MVPSTRARGGGEGGLTGPLSPGACCLTTARRERWESSLRISLPTCFVGTETRVGRYGIAIKCPPTRANSGSRRWQPCDGPHFPHRYNAVVAELSRCAQHCPVDHPTCPSCPEIRHFHGPTALVSPISLLLALAPVFPADAANHLAEQDPASRHAS